jgi:hypothetical protein
VHFRAPLHVVGACTGLLLKTQENSVIELLKKSKSAQQRVMILLRLKK